MGTYSFKSQYDLMTNIFKLCYNKKPSVSRNKVQVLWKTIHTYWYKDIDKITGDVDNQHV